MEYADNKTMQFGIHYMLDGYKADKDALADKAGLINILETLPGKVGMHTISTPVVVEVGPNNKKDPGGISGFVLVAESHISFHTFPGRGFVTIDAYTCNDTIDSDKITQYFTDFFKIKESDVKVIKRGTKYPVENIQ
ncbi:adenosylmethionine decarboxylase [Candidatus Nomurabacteria bacterium]|nr:adenosylmethionine decarboxylase [Candidatus Nomurabacteria bacterium]